MPDQPAVGVEDLELVRRVGKQVEMEIAVDIAAEPDRRRCAGLEHHEVIAPVQCGTALREPGPGHGQDRSAVFRVVGNDVDRAGL